MNITYTNLKIHEKYLEAKYISNATEKELAVTIERVTHQEILEI